MARYFKKRRPVGPSKNEEKIQRSREAEARERSAGRLSDIFPLVERLSVRLELLSPQNAPLAEVETRSFGPGDKCDFSVPCPGRCGQGSFNLAAKLQAVVESREGTSQSSGTCQEPLYVGSPDVCGVKLSCQIQIQYAETKTPELK